MPTKRRRLLQGVGAGLALGLAGCNESDIDLSDDDNDSDDSDDQTPSDPGESQNRVEGGIISIGLLNPPFTLNPLSATSPESMAILDHFMATGTTVDPTTVEVRPNVFTDWTVENADSGEPDIYFDVREDLTWNDGEAFDLEDVLFTYEYLDEQRPERFRSTVDPIAEVTEADNEWDVHMRLDGKIGTWESKQLGVPLLAEHVWSDYSNYQEYEPGAGDEFVGLGWADELSTFDPENSVEVQFRSTPLTELDWIENHPDLESGGPFLDGVEYRVYSSETALLDTFLTNNGDGSYSPVDPSNISDLEADEDSRTIKGLGSGFSFVGFNTRRTPFDDILFRQGLTFLWDEIYWIERLNEGRVVDGDFVIPPGYGPIRPETHAQTEIQGDPAVDVFSFRESSPGVPDYDGLRAFFEAGEPITGETTRAVGREYPGSLLDVRASIDEPLHDYEFGEVQTELLQEAGVEQELYVNGQTVPEILGRPITFLMYPPETQPTFTQADENWISNMIKLGIPVETQITPGDSLEDTVYVQEDFDLYHSTQRSVSPFAEDILEQFHSENADNRRDGNSSEQLPNPTGYGLFDYAGADDLIDEARTEMDADRRNALVARIAERVYLDVPYMVTGYDELTWPANTQDFAGFLDGLTTPTGRFSQAQFYNLSRVE